MGEPRYSTSFDVVAIDDRNRIFFKRIEIETRFGDYFDQGEWDDLSPYTAAILSLALRELHNAKVDYAKSCDRLGAEYCNAIETVLDATPGIDDVIDLLREQIYEIERAIESC